jgi:hypothetical protein
MKNNMDWKGFPALVSSPEIYLRAFDHPIENDVFSMGILNEPSFKTSPLLLPSKRHKPKVMGFEPLAFRILERAVHTAKCSAKRTIYR